VFRQLWQELGGSFDGTVRDAPVPAGALPLAAVESPTLAEAVRDTNKFSNNVMARQLLLTLGAERGTTPADEAQGAAAIRDWLKRKRLDFPELVIENGAGLSRIERISAEHLGQLLLEAWRSPVMPELIASLPVAGVDGTMKRRLNGQPAAGRAHIKSGSLDGVKTMAGYVLDRSGKRWVVVFLVNHPQAVAVREAQDALLEWIYGGQG
jgi:D-alanyl-D-alanine carboxypeptidase/D-alanyl-D-alanine-endopeptidase (penicillin-binding protein 4)